MVLVFSCNQEDQKKPPKNGRLWFLVQFKRLRTPNKEKKIGGGLSCS